MVPADFAAADSKLLILPGSCGITAFYVFRWIGAGCVGVKILHLYKGLRLPEQSRLGTAGQEYHPVRGDRNGRCGQDIGGRHLHFGPLGLCSVTLWSETGQRLRLILKGWDK